MNSLSPEQQKIAVDKEKFDAMLRKIATHKPLPLKSLTGTFNRLPSKRKKAAKG